MTERVADLYQKESTAVKGYPHQDYRRENQWRRLFRRALKLSFAAVGLNLSVRRGELDGYRYADLSLADKELIRLVRPHTMTSAEGLCALMDAVRHIVKERIPGEIVECGVWRGGSMAAAARTLRQEGCLDHHIYLFDTFQGMPQPAERDINWEGEKALDIYRRKPGANGHSDWCYASHEEVAKVMADTGYDLSKVHLVQGRVEETLPTQAPERIALLRLDTDFYESTMHELTHLFPRLSRGGIIIIDDYGHWQGAREATDEYFASQRTSIFLNRVDYTVRLGVKM